MASQQTVKHMSVFDTGIVIRFLTMCLLFVIMGIRGELKELVQVKGVLGRLLLIGVLGFSLDLTAFIGLTISSAGTGTALLKCDILFVNLISCLIYKKRFSKRVALYPGDAVWCIYGGWCGSIALQSGCRIDFLHPVCLICIYQCLCD